MAPAYAQHRRSIGLIGADEPDTCWLLKDPSHLFAPEALFATYPDANVVMTHRDPLKAVASVCSLTAVSRQGFEEHPDNIAHGAGQTELWARGIERMLAARAGREERFYDLQFADFQTDPLGSVGRHLRPIRLPARCRRRAGPQPSGPPTIPRASTASTTTAPSSTGCGPR